MTNPTNLHGECPQIWSQSLQTTRPVVEVARANPCGVCTRPSSTRCLRAAWATSKRHLIGQSQFMSKKQNIHWGDVNLLCSRQNSNPQWQPSASETAAWSNFHPRGPSQQVHNWKYSFGTACVCVCVCVRERERQRHALLLRFRPRTRLAPRNYNNYVTSAFSRSQGVRYVGDSQ